MDDVFTYLANLFWHNSVDQTAFCAWYSFQDSYLEGGREKPNPKKTQTKKTQQNPEKQNSLNVW